MCGAAWNPVGISRKNYWERQPKCMTIGPLAMHSGGVTIQCIGRKVTNAISERRGIRIPLYPAKDGTRPFAEETR